MLESLIVLIIVVLVVADLLLLAFLLIHHWLSARGRARYAIEKKAWREALLRGGSSGIAAPNPHEMAICGEALRELMIEDGGAHKKKFADLFDKFGMPAFYRARLRSRLWWRRGEAGLALGEAGRMEMLGDVAELLDDRFHSVRLKAANALAYMGSESSITYLLEHLDGLGYVSVQWLKDIFALILVDKPDVAVMMLTDKGLPVMIVKAVIETYGDLPEAKNSEAVAELVTDESRDIELRISAVKALGRLKKHDGAIRAALKSPSWEMRAAAAKALGDLGDPTAIPKLEQLLSDTSWWARVNSANALSRLGPDGIEALRKSLNGGDDFARDIARQTLSEIALAGEGGLVHG